MQLFNLVLHLPRSYFYFYTRRRHFFPPFITEHRRWWCQLLFNIATMTVMMMAIRFVHERQNMRVVCFGIQKKKRQGGNKKNKMIREYSLGKRTGNQLSSAPKAGCCCRSTCACYVPLLYASLSLSLSFCPQLSIKTRLLLSTLLSYLPFFIYTLPFSFLPPHSFRLVFQFFWGRNVRVVSLAVWR